MAGFGGAVKLTGESEYRKALQQITQSLKVVSAEMKAASSSFDAGDKSSRSLAKESKELSKSLAEQEKSLKTLKSQLSAMESEFNKNATAHKKLVSEYEKEKSELDKIGKTLGTSSDEYKKQEKVVAELDKEVNKSQKSIDAEGKAINDMRIKTANAETTMNSTAKAVDQLGKETKESGKDAEKAGDGYTVFKNILANLGTQAINAALDGLKKLGSAFIDVGKQAMSSYAEYEQLEGGVKKLFGEEDMSAVMENASRAFSTAGLSANEYMETVTSFSASLISGLKGDTEEAARVADIAIQDMADNANTFGTDMASVQAAYAGFAKDNFTLLDNLKLGYGGTASEMARLVNESGILNDGMEVTAETVKDLPFDQLVLAINKTQERMGIMGATAAEASGTIEGSVKAMKGAWQNLVVGIADENADLDGLINQFVDSVVTAAKNIVPRVKTIVSGISKVVESLLSEIGDLVDDEFVGVITDLLLTLVNTITSMLPQMIEAGSDIILKLIDGIVSSLPELTSKVLEIIPKIAENLISMLPQILQAGIDIIINLAKGLTDAIPKLIPSIIEAVKIMVQTLIDNASMLIDAGIELVMAIGQGLIDALPDLAVKIPELVLTLVEKLVDQLPKVIEGGVKLLSGLIEAIPEVVKGLGEHIPDIILAIVEGLLEGVTDVAKAAAELFFGIEDGSKKAKEKMGEVTSGIQEYADKLDEVAPTIADANRLFSESGNTIGDIDSAIRETEDTITEILRASFDEQEGLRQEDLTRIKQYQEQLVELENEKLQIYRGQQAAELKKIELDNDITQEEAAQYIANTKEALNQANQAVEAAYTARLTEIERLHQAGAYQSEMQYESEILAAKNYHDRQLDENQDFYDEGIALIQDRSKVWVAADKAKYDAANEYLDKYRKDTHSGLEYVGDVIGDFVGGFEEYSGDYADALAYVVDENSRGFLNMATAVKAGGDELDDETKGIVSSLLNNFEGLPEDFDEVGKEALAGLTYGMEDYIPELKDTSDMSAEEIVDAIRDYLDIHSPSQVMMDIGENTILGLTKGMEDEKGELSDTADSMAETLEKAFSSNKSNMEKVGQQMAEQVADGFNTKSKLIADKVTDTIKKVTQLFKLEDNNFKQIGIKLISQITDGVTFKQSSVTSKIKEIIAGIVATLNNTVSQFRLAGEAMAQGLWQGLSSQESMLIIRVKQMMNRVTTSARKAMQIESPSKVWAQIGDYMAQGLGVGFTNEMRYVTNDIVSSIPSGSDIHNTSSMHNKTEDPVSALKEALSEMKIELDDHEVGRFVDQTVTQLVYA